MIFPFQHIRVTLNPFLIRHSEKLRDIQILVYFEKAVHIPNDKKELGSKHFGSNASMKTAILRTLEKSAKEIL
jgi:hypothetical protein